MNKNLETIVNQLIDYYKELNDLKESGIDISKLAAHKVLFNLYTQALIDSIGLDLALAIQRYAEHPVGTIEEFIVYLKENYPENGVRTVTRPDVKELKECAEEKIIREKIESGEYTRKTVPEKIDFMTEEELLNMNKKESTAAKDEKVINDVCQKIPEYYVNGKKVAKEIYDEAMTKFDTLLTKLFKALDE